MDNKSLYKLSYGIFMLATKYSDKINGCIINTCIQVSSEPVRLAISCISGNYTTELIKKSGILTLSAMDQTATLTTIKHFGMQSGRNVNKFATLNYPLDANGIPYLDKESCAIFSCKVKDSIDLGSHILFTADVLDMFVTSSNQPLTYADYREKKKSDESDKTTNSKRKIKGWRCKICGYIFEGSELPTDYQCPLCSHGPEDFEPIYE